MNDEVLELFRNIRAGQFDGEPKPHKFALLLAIVDLYEESPGRDDIINLDSQLESLFEYWYNQLSPQSDFLSSMIEAPFYYLQNDKIYVLLIKPDKQEEYNDILNIKHSRFTKKRIIDVFSGAKVNNRVHLFLQNKEHRLLARKTLIELYGGETLNINQSMGSTQYALNLIPPSCNSFVRYLNTLQRSGGGNENALAESQACAEDFSLIQVSHPLANIIYDELVSPRGHHVILTGHAGDGKTTIALEILKRLRGVPSVAPLSSPMLDREECNGVTIIKDLSERNRQQDHELIKELKGRSRRFLLVSNTGTLLDLVKSQYANIGKSQVELEDAVLNAIDSQDGQGELALADDLHFLVFNLAQLDNLDIAQSIFAKMLAKERWQCCGSCVNAERCPVYTNVRVLWDMQDLAVSRIFLAYRRLYEYGTRLTMRQLTEHLAYIITSGLNEVTIQELLKKDRTLSPTAYLFTNRFFGEDGVKADPDAQEMKAVRAITEQHYGSRPSPGWERGMWLRNRSLEPDIKIPLLQGAIISLLRKGSSMAHDEEESARAREQVRRLYYFLYEFPEDQRYYLSQYLNSPAILDWLSWQDSNHGLPTPQKAILDKQIFRVLQEYFTGVRLPEGSSQTDTRLYITLNRRSNEIRQSAQVVLAAVNWKDAFELVLETSGNALMQQRQDLLIRGRNQYDKIELPLKLPFLDFVMMRHNGELGEMLDASYLQRLDRFKNAILSRAKTDSDDSILLVRLKTNHAFCGQEFTVQKGRLEVFDA